MSEQSDPLLAADPAGTERAQSATGDQDAWGMVSTLVSGPIVWGLAGAGIDALVGGTARVFMALGLVVGFLTSFYVVYVRYGRS